jgi:hypothetical protein
MFIDPTTPNQADYTTFLRGAVGIATGVLPDNDDSIPTTLSIAQDIVNEALSCASPHIYTLAVYNLAADRLLNFAIDQPNQTYFQDLRKQFRISDISVGVVASISDEGTSMSVLNPESMKALTLQDLQTLKTHYGRAYMGFAQMYGTNLWGLT